MSRTLRIGTRGTPLALRQAEWVVRRLRAVGTATALEVFDTLGDRRLDLPLCGFDDPGPFSSELDSAILSRRIDLAVHSLKDLPFALPSGLGLVAIGHRADPREVLVTRDGSRLDQLAPGSVIATSSERRRGQLLYLRPDLRIVDLRGAVGARLAALDAAPDWSAILIAAAGLERLGLSARAVEHFGVDRLTPAPGQGAIAVTGRLRDRVAASVARRAVEDPAVRVAVTAERTAVEALDARREFAAAAHATVRPGPRGWSISVAGCLVAVDGSTRCDSRIDTVVETALDAAAAGSEVAARLAANAEAAN